MLQDLLDNPEKVHRIDGIEFQSDASGISSGTSKADTGSQEPVDLTKFITRWNMCLEALAQGVSSQVAQAEHAGKTLSNTECNNTECRSSQPDNV